MPLGQTGLSDSWLVKVRNNVIIMEELAFRFKKKTKFCYLFEMKTMLLYKCYKMLSILFL